MRQSLALIALALAVMTSVGCQDKHQTDVDWQELEQLQQAQIAKTDREILDVCEESLIKRGKWHKKQIVAWNECPMNSGSPRAIAECRDLEIQLKNEGTRLAHR